MIEDQGPDPQVVKDAVMREHIVTVVTDAFPKYVDIQRRYENGDLCLRVSWLLRTDPARPHKSSRPIEVRITREALSDYSNGGEEQRTAADARLKQSLTECLPVFNPEHDMRAPFVPPCVIWLVSTKMLNG